MQSSQAQDSGAEEFASVKPYQIRGRFFTAIALRPGGETDAAFYDALDAQMRQMPHFFANAPLVVDLEQIVAAGAEVDLPRLVAALRQRKLSVFGVQNGTALQTEAALGAGLIALPSGREAPVERVERATRRPAAARAEPAPAPPGPTTRMITEPVRSGQKIVAEHGDLVVLASVGSGAELVAIGNIHVYGQLRGRALAGVGGDETARIFCQNLDAELLAIAGLYRTSEDLGPDIRKQRVQAFLRDEKLFVEALQ